MPSSKGRSYRRCTARIAGFPGFEAAEFARVILCGFFRNFSAAARASILSSRSWILRSGMCVSIDLAGEGDCALAEFSFDQGIDAPVKRLFGAEGVPERMALSVFSTPERRGKRCVPPAPGMRPSSIRASRASAEAQPCGVAHQGDFEAAAQRGAVDCRDHRLGTAFEGALDLGERRALRGFAKLGNVGAGNKRAPGANQTMALTAGSAAALPAPSRRPLRTSADSALTGGELIVMNRDIAFTGQVGYSIDGGHRALPLQSCRAGACGNKLPCKIQHMQGEGTAVSLFDLSGKVAMVTGSSRGIGRAIVERMAEQGATVVVVLTQYRALPRGGRRRSTQNTATAALSRSRRIFPRRITCTPR